MNSFKPIITSFLDLDLYKLTMQYAVINLYPWVHARYKFIDRDNCLYTEKFVKEVQLQVEMLKWVKITEDEIQFLKEKCYYFPPTYLDFLRGYRFDPKEVDISHLENRMDITIMGPWYRTILWETIILSIISELRYKYDSNSTQLKEVIKTAEAKSLYFKNNEIYFADFGTRRRSSKQHHQAVVDKFLSHAEKYFTGTSNVNLARRYNITPIGTQAHEWFMFHAAFFGVTGANAIALKRWKDVYRGRLGIALTDTFGTDIFFKNFDTELSKLFDGVRHDSGCPFVFVDKTIKHYQDKNIDPKTKTIVFSDGLNPQKANEIHQYCKGRIIDRYGIGTNLTHDIPTMKPPNIVIKLSQVKEEKDKYWKPCIKLSDVQGKYTGEEKVIETYNNIININL